MDNDSVMGKIRQRWNSNTYRAAFVMSLLAIIEANAGLLVAMLPPRIAPYWPVLFPLGMMILREFTTTALSDK